MPTIRVVSREEAQQTRKRTTTGVRRARMDAFDGYARLLIEHPEQAVVYTELDEEPQKFVLSLRGAFQRAGVPAVVRKMRGRDEVRAWIGAPEPRAPRPSAAPALPARRGRGQPRRSTRSTA